MHLLVGIFLFARPKNYLSYIRYFFKSIRYKWFKAIFLDLLLADFFIRQYKKGDYIYSSLFLNAGAHIQHHYLFDSDCYNGQNSNPKEYSLASASKTDPLYEVYSLYDNLIKDFINLDTKYMVTTGLQQTENLRPYYQYRFNDFSLFLNEFSINYLEVTPRMSRDFSIKFSNNQDLNDALDVLENISINNSSLFDIDISSDNSLFIKIAYNKDIDAFRGVKYNNNVFDISSNISLVSIENSIHKSKGWHVRNFANDDQTKEYIWDIKSRIIENI